MKAKLIQAILILAVFVAAFLALYLQKPVPQTQEKSQSWSKEKQKEEGVVRIPTIILPIDTTRDSHFGILGEGRGTDFTDSQMNEEVLTQLFQELKIREVQAIFFNGNILSGLEKGNDRTRPIDSTKLQQELNEFSNLYHNIFEEDVPLFPALGDREIAIPESSKGFIKEFHLQGAEILGGELLYTVSAGRAFFAVIATGEIINGDVNTKESFHHFMLEWLNMVLKKGAETHPYLFVVGHAPAFPSTTTFSKDKQPQRDAFWEILTENKVLAYFSSKEHLFDRSNRFGVLQVISGGGGAPFSHGGGSKPFYHTLVLTIPGNIESTEVQKKPQRPTVQVIDNMGHIVEEFSLGQENQPVYQMRISYDATAT